MRTFETIVADLKYALRQLRRNPGFAAAAIVSLTLGIGANTAAFSVLNAVLLRSLPVRASSELFKLTREARVPIAQRFSYRAFEDLRAGAEPGSVAAMSQGARVSVVDRGSQPERATVQLVSGEFFRLLGVAPALGRLLETADDRTLGAHPVAVVSHGYWQQRFAGAPDIVGKAIALNGSPFTVVGVAADRFRGVFLETPTDIWIPTMMQSDVRYHQNFSAASNADPEKPWILQDGIIWLDILVRAGSDATTSLTTSLNTAFRKELILQADAIGDPAQRKLLLDSRLVLESFSQGRSRLRERFTTLLYALMGMVALVLLVACANTANLLLARSAARQREIAVRLSIGAGRGRLIQQLLTESLLLAGVATIGGVLLAQSLADALVRMIVQSLTGSSASIVEIDARVLTVTALVSLLTGVLFGLVPALRATDLDLCASLKIGGRSVQTPARWNPARLLIGAQIALSLVLVTTAGLFGRSLYNLTRVELGFDRDRVLNIAIDPRTSGVAAAALPSFYARLRERVESVPGVKSAAFAECALAGGCRSASDGIVISGYTPAPAEQVTFQENRVSAEYLTTVGIRLLRGRNFDARDRQDTPKVAIVNQTLVQRYFAGRDALGQKFGYQTPDIEIVGVIADARVYSAREPAEPMAYYPLEQAMIYTTSMSVKAAGDPRQVVSSVRDAIQASAPALVVDRITTLAQQVDIGFSADRIVALLASAFGALALVLASVGLYGLMSYSVARRTAEMGLRMALGARPGAVLRGIMMESAGLVIVGLLIGVPLAAAGGRLISSILFGVGPWDGLTMMSAIVTLAVLGASAAFIPAWRASRVDPIVALRQE